MEDRYLYRAKRTDNGEWVEGYYCKRKTGHYDNIGFHYEYKDCIIVEFSDGGITWCDVDPSTICQCTGLKDKNGKLIWENDIIKKEFFTNYDLFANSEEYIGIVKYEDCAWCVSYERNGYKCNSPIFMALEYHDAKYFNVIGNIFDNPDFFKM